MKILPFSAFRTDLDTKCKSVETWQTKMETIFKDTNTRIKKHFFEELENRQHISRERFRINIFVLDTYLGQPKTPFDLFQVVIDTFLFMFSGQVTRLSQANLELQITQFINRYNTAVSPGLLRQDKNLYQASWQSIQYLLNTVMKMKCTTCFPDFAIAFCIFLTLSITAARRELHLSKLKIIKSYF